MDKIVLKAPAKVNLFLKVIGRRADGYHDIETLFEKIGLFDKITLEMSCRISVSSDNNDMPKEQDDLTFKAAKLLEERCKMPLGVSIKIEKSIPVGAGLGGGSSDAAAVLKGLNSLYKLELSTEELSILGAKLGADVPFFISERTWAIGRQRGDSIEPFDTQMKLWHLLIVPRFVIRAKEAYDWKDQSTKVQRRSVFDTALSALKNNDIEALGNNLYNDLEGATFKREPFVEGLKKGLVDAGARGAMVSGSGPCLFGIIDKEKEVLALKKRVEQKIKGKESFRVFVAPTLCDQ